MQETVFHRAPFEVVWVPIALRDPYFHPPSLVDFLVLEKQFSQEILLQQTSFEVVWAPMTLQKRSLRSFLFHPPRREDYLTFRKNDIPKKLFSSGIFRGSLATNSSSENLFEILSSASTEDFLVLEKHNFRQHRASLLSAGILQGSLCGPKYHKSWIYFYKSLKILLETSRPWDESFVWHRYFS